MFASALIFCYENCGVFIVFYVFILAIRSMVKMVDATLDRNQQKLLDKKLEKCRNPENNPDSEM